jgi:hypothetical protein
MPVETPEDLMHEAVVRLAESLDPAQQVQVQLMKAAGRLPTWSPRLTKLGLVAENGLLTELGLEVATHLLEGEL